MGRVPSFLSNQPTSNLNSRGGNQSSGNRSSSGWFEFKEKMDSLSSKKNEVLKQAADAIADYGMKLNNSGESDVKSITKNLITSLEGFTEDEKNQILSLALAKIIANI